MLQIPNQENISALRSIVSEKFFTTDPKELAEYGQDWTKRFLADPSCVLFPGSVEEIQAIAAYCNKHHLAITPSGGRSGLAGGAVATHKEVVLSLKRLNKILRVDTVGLLIEAEAGVITQNLQETALAHGFFYPIDLAAKGTCQLGGNIATNAGGLKLIRYGGMREQVLGLEVVLADGSILDLNRALRKDNCGYDLKHLFIGSEGTLGIVTKATVKLVQKPTSSKLALLGVQTFEAICAILKEANLRGLNLSAFEFFTLKAHNIVVQHYPSLGLPFSSPSPFFVLIEADAANFEDFISYLFEAGLVEDGRLASSSAEFSELWKRRELISESIALTGHVRKNDITLAVADLAKFYSELIKLEEQILANTGVDLVLFGHVGDGNIHLNYSAVKSRMSAQEFHEIAVRYEAKMFQKLIEYRGSVSAEHGIGLLKKADLKDSRGEGVLNLMRSVKQIFDPRGIMNPGKIF